MAVAPKRETVGKTLLGALLIRISNIEIKLSEGTSLMAQVGMTNSRELLLNLMDNCRVALKGLK